LKVRCIVSGEREQSSVEDDSESNMSEYSITDSVSELGELLKATGNSITWLFKISMILRNPTPIDRYAKAELIGTYSTESDIDYVRHKVPYLQRSGAEGLIERLGKANTRRREYLRYCEKHRKKLAYIAPTPKSDPEHEDPLAIESDELPRSIFTMSSHIAPSSVTDASTYMENSVFQQAELENRNFETQSVTSYATSIENEEAEVKLRVPAQPQESLDGSPFECPYCYTIRIIDERQTWR
jgi:DNA-binding MarR family transcriptional regulator